MGLMKTTGGLGNRMFIHATYLKTRAVFPDTRTSLSGMARCRARYGYGTNRVFRLPRAESSVGRGLEKTAGALSFKTVLERKQGGSPVPYTRKCRWPWVCLKGFSQSGRCFAGAGKEVREAFGFGARRASGKSLGAMPGIMAGPDAVSLHVGRGRLSFGEELAGRMARKAKTA